MAGLCEGGNEPPDSLKAINCPKTGVNLTSDIKKAPLMKQLDQEEDLFWVQSTYGQKTRALDVIQNDDYIKFVCTEFREGIRRRYITFFECHGSSIEGPALAVTHKLKTIFEKNVGYTYLSQIRNQLATAENRTENSDSENIQYVKFSPVNSRDVEKSLGSSVGTATDCELEGLRFNFSFAPVTRWSLFLTPVFTRFGSPGTFFFVSKDEIEAKGSPFWHGERDQTQIAEGAWQASRTRLPGGIPNVADTLGSVYSCPKGLS
ncbi:hypothetical protein ANN_09619 [Periplaneta americana]|uniref:Uncharacterized protein n=1 Tax=Periplaneta americana TaxID=6978 RepID=A0ABQ8TM67_PERAM|nr:hypothetical protein ANN_09619 [Periplaneta americana]